MNIGQLIRSREQTFVVPQKRRKFLNERAELIRCLLEGINNSPNRRKFFGFNQVGHILKPFSVEGLQMLLKECEAANHFGSYFWYKIKQRNAVSSAARAKV